jgi:hypothetical protein
MKKLSILLAIVLVISVASFATASGPRTTGFQIQNLGTTAVTVTITYYETDGTVECTDTGTIGVGESRSWYQGATAAGGNSCVSALAETSWQGSAVIESTGPIAVIANIAEATDYASGAYVGTPDTQVGQTMILPAIMDGGGFYGFTTDFAVQNAGAAAATCTYRFYGTDTGTEDKTVTGVSIAVGASNYRDQEAAPDDLPGTNWLGVVVAECDQPMAATINQKPVASGAGALLTYDGVARESIPAGSDVSLPVIMYDYYDYWTGVQLVATEANTAGTIRFFDSNGTEVFNEAFGPLSQYGSHNVLPSWTGGTFSGTADELYSGVIAFTSGNGTAMVNQRDMAGAVGMTYSGIYAAGLTNNLSIPFAAHNFWGVSTGFQVVNSGAAGTITVHYDPTPTTGSSAVTSVSIPLAAGEAVPLQQFMSGGNDPALSGCTTCGSYGDGVSWTGSVRVEGTAGMLLSAIVNERGYDLTIAGDVGQVYNPFSY